MQLLVAVDGSEASAAALEHACDLAEATDGSVTLVHAVNPDVYAEADPAAGVGSDDLVQSVERSEAEGERVLSEAEATVTDRGVAFGGAELLYGDPTEAIADYAADGFDGVVVGHRGLSDRYERVLGSVAKGLIGRSPVPVTVVRIENDSPERL